MTLRLLFQSQQLLFATSCAIMLLGGTMKGQDLLILGNNTQQAGKVTGVNNGTVAIQIGTGGSIALPLNQIKEARVGVPVELAQVQNAIAQKNFDAALTIYKAGLEKFKGLPTEWAQQATALAGDIYIEKGDLPKAKAAYADFQKLYPSSAQAELGLAKLAVAEKDFATAKAKLEPVIAKANEDKAVTRTSGSAYGQAFLLMGQVKEAAGELAPALEDYLKTVTVYYQDRTAVALAQQKADALRKANPRIYVP